MTPAYVYGATVKRVIDGDTLAVDVDLGFHVRSVMLCRLSGLNARELSQDGGPDARDNLLLLTPPGTPVVLRSVRADKYAGRFDAIVYLPDGSDLNAALIEQGWAAPWDGRGTRPVPVWPR